MCGSFIKGECNGDFVQCVEAWYNEELCMMDGSFNSVLRSLVLYYVFLLIKAAQNKLRRNCIISGL